VLLGFRIGPGGGFARGLDGLGRLCGFALEPHQHLAIQSETLLPTFDAETRFLRRFFVRAEIEN